MFYITTYLKIPKYNNPKYNAIPKTIFYLL